MLEQLNSVFYDEANELLDNLEEQLLTLEANPEDADTISAVFRAMHTIKGSAAMFGFNVVSSFTHEVESTLDQVRNGTVPVTQELIDLTLKARDQIRDMLNAGADIPGEVMMRADGLINQFKLYVGNHGGTVSAAKPVQSDGGSIENVNAETETFRIAFRPSKTIMLNGTRPELLVKELSEMGTASIVPFVEEVPALDEIDPEKCYVAWDVILTTKKTRNDVNDVFIFLDSESKVDIERIEVSASSQLRIGEILVDRGHVKQEQLDSVMSEHKQIGQILVDKKIISQEQVQSALVEQKHLKNISLENGTNPGQGLQPTIRVSSLKLDKLVDLVGELVTFNAHLEQSAIETNNPGLRNLSEQCGRLVVQLRDASMGMRMVPIGTLFQKFRRTIRDLAEQLGKSIEMQVEGAETELDKTVVEKLNDPMLHLVRNSVDHGVELPAERAAEGKDPMGHVKLSAVHAGSFVLISISDDGKGIDKEVLYKKGIERGLLNPNQDYSDAEIYDLIFNPGFSTAKKVTSISGRGVGLDVVKKDISSLGGNCTVETELGKGTSFILKIPLTLAIIDGMLVQIGQTKYVIPLNTIQECLLMPIKKNRTTEMFPSVELHGKEMRCINLRKFFGVEDPLPQRQEIVAVNDQNDCYGLIVDKILGDHQTVIKPLGGLYKNCLGISSSTILGDGSVALVADVFKLSEIIKSTEKDK